MTHLDIETQVMVKREAGSQIGNLTPDHRKSGIKSIYLRAGGGATCRWKALNEGYNFGLDLVLIEGLHKKL
jgi:hypothetical protein